MCVIKELQRNTVDEMMHWNSAIPQIGLTLRVSIRAAELLSNIIGSWIIFLISHYRLESEHECELITDL